MMCGGFFEVTVFFNLLLFCANANKVDDVGNLIGQFSKMTDASADVLVKLKNIGAGTYSLLKFAGPIGQIMHTGISLALKEDSEELQAIKSLRETMTTKFDEISRKIDHVIATSQYTESMRSYGLEISLNIQFLEHLMKSALSSRRQLPREIFELNCKESHNPLKMLLFIDRSFKTNCNLRHHNYKREAKIYARAISFFRQINDQLENSSKNNITKTNDYTNWKIGMIMRLTDLPPNVAKLHLKMLEKVLAQYGAFNLTKMATVAQFFTHQVVVGASWSAEFFSKSCEPSTCTSIIGKGDVNIVITRYNEMEDDLYERLETGRKWLKGNRLGMQSELGNQLKLHGGKADLTGILSYVKSKAISRKNLYGKYFFRNFILLHNRKWFTKDCVIPVGVAGSTMQGMSAYDDETEYLDTSFYSVANKYKLIFLL
uniref:Fibrinogen C-terminal domain-containing protein n=1 Tax=Globodera pallida TaxID=36090 RepID=A0A183CC88_GLOPA